MYKSTCPHCSNTFVTERKTKKYCSKTCKDRAKSKRTYYADPNAWNQKSSAKYFSKRAELETSGEIKLIRNCVVCGSTISAPTLITKACSEVCRKELKNKGRRGDKRKQSPSGRIDYYCSTFRRRAEHYGVRYERFDKHEIYARDNWVCGICGTPIDKTKTFPSPASPSLDHIIPMSKGGPHTRQNTQAAHLSCNAGKKNQEGYVPSEGVLERVGG